MTIARTTKTSFTQEGINDHLIILWDAGHPDDNEDENDDKIATTKKAQQPAILVLADINNKDNNNNDDDDNNNNHEPEQSKHNLGNLLRVHGAASILVKGSEDPSKLVLRTLDGLHTLQLGHNFLFALAAINSVSKSELLDLSLV